MPTDRINNFFLILGRVLMSLIFLESGYGKITGFAGTAAFMEAKGMPLVPLLLTGAIVTEIVGGLSLLLGVKALRALLLFLFLIPTTLIFHNLEHTDARQKPCSRSSS